MIIMMKEYTISHFTVCFSISLQEDTLSAAQSIAKSISGHVRVMGKHSKPQLLSSGNEGKAVEKVSGIAQVYTHIQKT